MLLQERPLILPLLKGRSNSLRCCQEERGCSCRNSVLLPASPAWKACKFNECLPPPEKLCKIELSRHYSGHTEWIGHAAHADLITMAVSQPVGLSVSDCKMCKACLQSAISFESMISHAA